MSSLAINFLIYTFFSSALLAHIFGFGSNHLGQKYQQQPQAEVLGAQEKAQPQVLFKEQNSTPPPQTETINRGSQTILITKQANSTPVIQAPAALLKDLANNRILFAKQADTPRSIASITKLMTALVFLEHNPGWDKIYEIKRSDRRWGGKIYLYLGEHLTVKDLFYASLVGSANTATAALVASTGLSEEEFVQEMNKKVIELGLKKTVFYDPTGLDQRNVSTPAEIAKFGRLALSNKDIKQATMTKVYFFQTQEGHKKTIPSTDYLLDVFPVDGIQILGGKTGYNQRARYCFVGLFKNKQGKEFISVVMGADSKNARFEETRKLVEYYAIE